MASPASLRPGVQGMPRRASAPISRGLSAAPRVEPRLNGLAHLRMVPSQTAWPIGTSKRRQHLIVRAEPPSSNGSGPDKPESRADEPAETSSKPTSSPDVKKDAKVPRDILGVPLKWAATLAKGDAHFLQIRKRKKWWKRGDSLGLRIPADSIEEQELPEPAVELWKKMIPLAVIFFCASFNLTILQNLRDSIVVTAGGAEVLPFLSSYCVLPASIGFFAYYSRITSVLNSKKVFYFALMPLIAAYLIFSLVLFPAHTTLHPTGMANTVASHLPAGLLGLVKVVENWTFSFFFCAAELWGTVVISLLFWSLANDVCSVAEAKTVYPLIGFSANIALVVAGNYIKFINSGPAAADISASLAWLISTVVVATGVMCSAKAFIDHKDYYAKAEGDATKPSKKKKKSKGSFAESIEVLKSSPKILNLALLVIGYGVCHRLFEFAWKGQLRLLYPSPVEYQSILSDVSIYTGVATMVLMLGGRFVFQYLGWGVAASATPLVMMASGAGFFGLSVAAQYGMTPFGMSAVALASAGATAGAITQVFARSSKFSLFDPAKEMVYIEMTKEEKSKGKAAVDLVGSQIGKSGASWITQALLLTMGSISAALPLTTLVYACVLLLWLKAVNSLQSDLKHYEEDKAAKKAEKEAQSAVAVVSVDESMMSGSLDSSTVDASMDNPSPDSDEEVKVSSTQK